MFLQKRILLILSVSCFLIAMLFEWVWPKSKTYTPPYTSSANLDKIHFPENYFTTKALDFAAAFLQKNKIDTTLSTLEIIRNTELLIYNIFEKSQDSIHIVSPPEKMEVELEAFQIAYNKQAKADCGHYTKTLSLFLESMHIKTRIVGMQNLPEAIGAHTYCEVWIPELKQWIYTDMTFNIFTIKTENKYLITENILELVANKSFQNASYLAIDTNRISNTISFQNNMESCFNNAAEIMYYGTNNTHYFANTFIKKLQNRFFFRPNMYLISATTTSNNLYFLRTVITWLGALLLIIYLVRKAV